MGGAPTSKHTATSITAAYGWCSFGQTPVCLMEQLCVEDLPVPIPLQRPVPLLASWNHCLASIRSLPVPALFAACGHSGSDGCALAGTSSSPPYLTRCSPTLSAATSKAYPLSSVSSR